MALLERETLAGRYEVIRPIKSGGMGAVYEAVDHKLADSPCAIKEILPSALSGPNAAYVLQSFESEMRSLARLEHPSIPRVRDYFDQGGSRYIVLDLVQGRNLDEELQEHLRLTGKPVEPQVAVFDMISVLETLSYLHQQRPVVLHRDIKCANLIRDQRTGKIKLVDFGIARAVDTQKVQQTCVGTPGYCAPEQMTGRAEPRSDLYSVGATLYHLCTGHAPPAFTFDPLDEALPSCPQLSAIIGKATHPKTSERYANAEELAEALKAWLRSPEGGKTVPVAASPAPKPNPIPVRHTIQPLARADAVVPQPRSSLFQVALIGVLVGLSSWLFVTTPQAESSPAPTPSKTAPPLDSPQPEPAPVRPIAKGSAGTSPPRTRVQTHPQRPSTPPRPHPVAAAKPLPTPSPAQPSLPGDYVPRAHSSPHPARSSQSFPQLPTQVGAFTRIESADGPNLGTFELQNPGDPRLRCRVAVMARPNQAPEEIREAFLQQQPEVLGRAQRLEQTPLGPGLYFALPGPRRCTLLYIRQGFFFRVTVDSPRPFASPEEAFPWSALAQFVETVQNS